MRIVIDMQGAQSSGSRNRGIGRYTLALVEAMVKKGKHEFVLALNGLFEDTLDDIRSQFTPLVGEQNIVVWTTPSPVYGTDESSVRNRQVAEIIREVFIQTLSPDFLIITSLFEGFSDNAVTSIGESSKYLPTAVILYDLIPYICYDIYLSNPSVSSWYESKLQYLRRADLLLAISDSSRKDALEYLGIPTELTVNISSAASNKIFYPVVDSGNEFSSVSQKYKITKPFVMYTGGIDVRKNIDSLIIAFSLLEQRIREKHQLVIVCAATEETKFNLRKIASLHMNVNDLIITGFVSENELVAFYNNCKLFVFPSWMEGFGLPLLEAMQCGAPVIGSDCSAIPEVIGLDDALFDPHSLQSMTKKMSEVLSDDQRLGRLKEHSLKQSKKFSWDRSAEAALAAIEIAYQNSTKLNAPFLCKRLRMAFVSPLPPEYSGIADYAAHLLPELARHYDIDLIINQEQISDPALIANYRAHSVEWFTHNAARYDRIVYQIGNSTYHSHMFNLLQKFPGTVVLHDFFLSGINYHREASGEVSDKFSRSLYEDHGYRALLERVEYEDIATVISRYPVNASVLNSARGVIVHSHHAKKLAESFYGPHAPSTWAHVASVRPLLARDNKQRVRERLGIDPEAFVVCSFGHLADTKLNLETVQAFSQSLAGKSQNSLLVFVGAAAGSYEREILNVIDKDAARKRMKVTGRVASETYQDYLAASDIAVQLRAGSRGETSAAILDTMDASVATITNSAGSMVELPPDCVSFLPETFKVDDLAARIDYFAQNPDEAVELGARAHAHIRTHHTPRIVADSYAAAIERFYEAPWPAPATIIEALQYHNIKFTPSLAVETSVSVARTFRPTFGLSQVLLDISAFVTVPEAQQAQFLIHLLKSGIRGYRIEPVYFDHRNDLRYAHQFIRQIVPSIRLPLDDANVDFHQGDILLTEAGVQRIAPALHREMPVVGVQLMTEFQGIRAFPFALPELANT